MADKKKRSLPPWLKGKDDEKGGKGKKSGLRDKSKKKGGFVPFKKKDK
jgi:hypothetical protein